jgi:phenylpropionate dioxygenase-like ring-hydroxylating dioxygenase large terminal subunit
MRLFAEELDLYRDSGGTLGLVDRHCSHRRADLSYGNARFRRGVLRSLTTLVPG